METLSHRVQIKCSVMRFYSKDVTPYYTIDNHVINPSGIQQNQNNLGVVMDNNLSGCNHCMHICCQVYNSMNYIKRLFSTNSPINVKKSSYISFVRSKFLIVHKSGYCDYIKTS